MATTPTAQTGAGSFLTDVKTLRQRARERMGDRPVTDNYQGDKEQTIELLQAVLATEIVCVLRYQAHSISAEGITSESVSEEFAEHANDEQKHVMLVANRIDQLGGKPDFDPATLTSRAVTEYSEGETLIDMIKENLVAERIVIEHYRELIRFFGEKDPTTRVTYLRAGASGASFAVLDWNGKEYRLAGADSGGGARYSGLDGPTAEGHGLQWWEAKGEASLGAFKGKDLVETRPLLTDCRPAS